MRLKCLTHHAAFNVVEEFYIPYIQQKSFRCVNNELSLGSNTINTAKHIFFYFGLICPHHSLRDTVERTLMITKIIKYMHIDIPEPQNQCYDMYKMNYHMTICIPLFKCKAID